MNILFLPENVASMPALTAAKMNEVESVQAICVTQALSKYHATNEWVKYIPQRASKRNPVKWIKTYYSHKREIKKWIEWADVLHYTWGPAFDDGRDLEWASKAGKPIFIEWVGSDIRDPNILKEINPFYKLVLENGYEYASLETRELSQRNQKHFAVHGAIPVVCPEMKLYVDKKLFPQIHLLFQRIDVDSFECRYPDRANRRPLIIHSPSAKIAKGSNYIIPVIEELKKDFDFDFKLLHNVSRSEVLTLMRDCDIFLDQIMLGSYGMATMEALSFGKPVVAFIMQEVFDSGLPSECPIYNTNPDNLKENLIELIKNEDLRYDLGVKGRQYAKKYHDLSVNVPHLLDMYRLALSSK